MARSLDFKGNSLPLKSFCLAWFYLFWFGFEMVSLHSPGRPQTLRFSVAASLAPELQTYATTPEWKVCG